MRFEKELALIDGQRKMAEELKRESDAEVRRLKEEMEAAQQVRARRQTLLLQSPTCLPNCDDSADHLSSPRPPFLPSHPVSCCAPPALG